MPWDSNLKRVASLAVIGVLVALPLAAEGELGARLMPMNTRLFDLGVEEESLGRSPHFIPLNRAEWLGDLINEDPLLRGEVIHIRVLQQPVTQLWQFPGPASQYKYSDNIRTEFILPGYETRSSTPDNLGSFFFLPVGEDPDFSVTCSLDSPTRRVLTFCALYANYPPDPNIFILVRIYNPDRYRDLAARFRDIAQRVREIVYCLDVTDRTPQEVVRFDRLDNLAGCQPEVIS